MAAAAVLALVVAFVVREAAPALWHVGTRFVTDPDWTPAPRAADGSFLLLPMLAGTFLVSAGAVLLAAPLGLLAAVWMHFYAPRRAVAPVRRMFELLGGIPSVVYGFWGLVVLVPWIGAWQPPGQSVLAAVVVLSLMLLPLMALSADAALVAVPHEHLAGAAALALSQRATAWHVALPVALPGLRAGLLLQAGRAVGETMAVLMVCGNVVQVPSGPFAPTRTLTANIALEMAYALGDHRSALFVSGLVLLAFVGLLLAAGVTAASGPGRRLRGRLPAAGGLR